MLTALKITAAAALFVVSGCTSYSAVKQTAVGLATVVAETAVKDSVFTICKGAPIGVVLEEFGTTQARVDAWVELCQPKTTPLFTAPVKKD